jgi:hypothetical protein
MNISKGRELLPRLVEVSKRMVTMPIIGLNDHSCSDSDFICFYRYEAGVNRHR